MLSILGLVGGLALLIWLTVRGVNILVAGPVAAFLVAITSNITLLPPLPLAMPPISPAPIWAALPHSFPTGF